MAKGRPRTAVWLTDHDSRGDPGRHHRRVADLAVTLALSGDCLADIAMLRAEHGPFGPVASDQVVSRWIPTMPQTPPSR